MALTSVKPKLAITEFACFKEKMGRIVSSKHIMKLEKQMNGPFQTCGLQAELAGLKVGQGALTPPAWKLEIDSVMRMGPRRKDGAILAWEPPGRLAGWGQSCSIPMLLSPVGVHCGPQGSIPSTLFF